MFIIVKRFDKNDESQMELIGKYKTLEEAKEAMVNAVNQYMEPLAYKIDFLLDTWSADGMNCEVSMENGEDVANTHWGILEV